MGLVYVDMNVSAPGKAARTVRFLVDSGAAYSVLPQKVWKDRKLKPKRTLEFTLADGSTIVRKVSECRFELGGNRRHPPPSFSES
jgi:predicted aspartyl protease